MRLFITTVFFFFLSHYFCQNHIKWTFEYDEKNEAVVVSGNIDSSWHTYSIQNKNNSGPVPTTITLEKKKGYKIVGKVKEISFPKKVLDLNFDSELFIFDEIYTAQVPIKFKKEAIVVGKVTYMVCDDSKCFPPIDVPFTLKVKK